jgi:hypothetical protein
MLTTNAALNAALDKCQGGEFIDEGLDIHQPIQIANRSFNTPVTILGGHIAPEIADIPLNWSRAVDVVNVMGVNLNGISIRCKEPTMKNGQLGYDGIALNLTNAVGVQMLGLDISSAYRCVVAEKCQGLLLADSKLHDLQSDAIDFADVDGSTLRRIHISRFFPFMLDDGSADHPDGVQFWSVEQKSDSVGNLLEDLVIEGHRDRRNQGIFLSDALFGGHKGTVIRRVLVTESLWHGIYAGGAPGAVLEQCRVMSTHGGQVVPGGPVLPWIAVTPDAQVTACEAPNWINGAGWDAPAGSLKTGYSTAEQIEAAVKEALARIGQSPDATPAPTPAPAPSPADILRAERDRLVAKVTADTVARDAMTRDLAKSRARIKTIDKLLAKLG